MRSLLEAEPVQFAILHGSAAAGRDFHDLDLAVMMASGDDALTYMFSLADRLEIATGLPMDVHVLNQAPVGFAYNVSKGVVLSARNPEALSAWRERVWTEYFDIEPYWRQMARTSLGLEQQPP